MDIVIGKWPTIALELTYFIFSFKAIVAIQLKIPKVDEVSS